MTEETTEREIPISPTIIVWAGTGESSVGLRPSGGGLVTAGEGEKRALIVFRGPEDAFAYQRHTGKHTDAEGFKVVGVLEERALATILETQDLRYVAMPEPWAGGAAGVDLFTAGNFLRMLEESR